MEKYALIVAGGIGKRMGSNTPKQFLPINGRAILLHTLDAFRKAIPNINFVLVLPKDHLDDWKTLAADSVYSSIPIAEGGQERTESVKAGLALIPEGALVGIHDSVRPLVSEECIISAFNSAEEHGNAIPVVDMAESIRKVEGQTSKAEDRSQYKIVQTPQCFHTSLIKRAYAELDGSYTDDASVLEANGERIHLVAGNRENIKITQPSDLQIASALLKNS